MIVYIDISQLLNIGLGRSMEKTKNFLLKSLFTVFVVFTIGLVISQVAHAKSADIKSAGTVTFTTGDASIVRADKSVVKAAKNDAVNAGDTIETKNGRLQLSLIDGGKVSLQPNTIYKINKYEFSGKEDGSEYAFTELLKGGMRTISGLIGHKNRERYQLKTAVATIGIRGTEFTVNFNNNQLLMTTNHGSVDVCNAGGCLNAMTGQSITVSGFGAAPKPSNKAAEAAAAAPATSNKVAFSASDTVTDSGVPIVIAQSITPLPINTNVDAIISNDQSVLISNNVADKASPPINLLTSGTGGLVGTYNVVASTAPIMVKNNNITAVGVANSVSGNLSVDFSQYSFIYTLTVPIAGTTYTQNSSGSLTPGSPSFRDIASADGVLNGGSMVEGLLVGSNAEAIALRYGFEVSGSGVPGGGGEVHGAAVLQK